MPYELVEMDRWVRGFNERNEICFTACICSEAHNSLSARVMRLVVRMWAKKYVYEKPESINHQLKPWDVSDSHWTD